MTQFDSRYASTLPSYWDRLQGVLNRYLDLKFWQKAGRVDSFVLASFAAACLAAGYARDWNRTSFVVSVIVLGENRGKHRSGRLETRSALRIVRELGQSIGVHVWCHGLRHSAITTAIEKGQQAGIGLDQIRAYSRHRTLTTMLIYRDEHDRSATQRQLADVVASTLEQSIPAQASAPDSPLE